MGFALGIAGALVQAETDGVELAPGPEHEPFLVEPRGPADLTIRFSSGAAWFTHGEQLFDGDGMFRFYSREGEGPLLTVASGPRLRCEIGFSSDYTLADYRLSPWPAEATLPLLPRGYELACQSRLGRLGVLLVHAVGLSLDGVGVLLPGSSGRGKSTLAGLFPESATLSDERVALSEQAGPWVHGTPWRGTAGRVSAASAPLRALLFLGEHAPPFGVRPLGKAEAFRRLFFHGLPPLWDREGLEATLDLARSVSEQVPAGELRWSPERGPEQVRDGLHALGVV